ncbi:MAG: protein kinase domain-containing protein [Eubacterium sp.]
MNKARKHATSGTVIKINNAAVVEVDKYVGEGTTSLVYEGKLLDKYGDKRVIIKEFYPDMKKGLFDIDRLENGELKVSRLTKNNSEYNRLLQQFRDCYQKQIFLSNSKAMDIMVKPIIYGQFGDSFYIINDIHSGRALENNFSTLSEKLLVCIKILEALEILHETNYIMLDFKPENILYIDKLQQIKLFDVDSVVDLNELDKIELEEIRFNRKYLSPEMKFFIDKSRSDVSFFYGQKKIYMTKKNDIYSLGFYMYQLLLNDVLDPMEYFDAKNIENMLKKNYGCSREISQKLSCILKKALEKRVIKRYKSVSDFMSDLKECYKMLTSTEFLSKKRAAKANYLYLSYHMLDKFPVFDYETDDRSLNVALAGNHALRKEMLQSIIPCVQMLGRELNIHIISKDALEFWNEFSAEKSNPELRHTVKAYLNSEVINDRIDKRIVSRSLANIYLHTGETENHIVEIKDECNYFILLDEDEKRNQFLLHYISNITQTKTFVGYVYKENNVSQSIGGNITAYPMGLQKVFDKYNENRFKTNLYKRALKIHGYYYRETHKDANWMEIEQNFQKDDYSIVSSERSALHIRYKLQSVGINMDSRNAIKQFNEGVLDAKENGKFDKLADLEHISWCAYLIVTGAVSVKDSDELMKYAYEGKNDWKKRDNAEHIHHPGLKASRPGNRLKYIDWNEVYEETFERYEGGGNLDFLDKNHVISSFDELERWNIIVNFVTMKKKKEKITRVFKNSDENSILVIPYILEKNSGNISVKRALEKMGADIITFGVFDDIMLNVAVEYEDENKEKIKKNFEVLATKDGQVYYSTIEELQNAFRNGTIDVDKFKKLKCK